MEQRLARLEDLDEGALRLPNGFIVLAARCVFFLERRIQLIQAVLQLAHLLLDLALLFLFHIDLGLNLVSRALDSLNALNQLRVRVVQRALQSHSQSDPILKRGGGSTGAQSWAAPLQNRNVTYRV